jgi:NADP-dependent 3-hydroxy acid dehydrogenase YdfG
MKTINFNNKICWITGASSGIGAAMAQALNETG